MLMAYVLLDTVQSIAPQKRHHALGTWLAAMRDEYGIQPVFVHTDKDFAEIGAAKDVWPDAKHQLCYWHLRKAVQECMALSRLSTALYHPFEANHEFGFINLDFLPRCHPDKSDPDAEIRTTPLSTHVPGPTRPPCKLPPIRIAPSQLSQLPPASQPLTHDYATVQIGNIKLKLQVLPPNAVLDTACADLVHVEDEGIERCVIFCPEDVCPLITRLMERHFCAHPLLPGKSTPDPASIRFWAVKEMYNLCYEHELPELWAYLWEGWYWPGRWELWARSMAELVPRLKTTMICEAQ
jgi:hypothetical protein